MVSVRTLLPPPSGYAATAEPGEGRHGVAGLGAHRRHATPKGHPAPGIQPRVMGARVGR
jgi:hypothetical protein